MKLMKLLLVIMAAAVITLALGGSALAFHAGGVAYCAGCHTMHNSQDGQQITDTPGGYLLLQVDASSACLRCHADYGQMTTDGSGYGSGGDYYWLKRTWTWTAHGHESSSKGESHGHSIIAADFGLPQGDQTLSKAPGGAFDSSTLSCASCHDPHGKGDAPLLLRNNASYANGTAIFPAGPVMATLSRRTTVGEGGYSTDSNHVAYGSGMSAWCAACHWTFDDGLNAHMHPTNEALGTEHANNYNQYITSGDMSGGTDKTGKYLELVPFETGATDEADLDTSSTDGPDAGSKVACISCHRAHATAFQDSGRWDFHAEVLVDSHPDGADDGSTPAEKLNSYYGRTISTDFSEGQRSLCNKCHAQDTG
jgi:cytochrome c553